MCGVLVSFYEEEERERETQTQTFFIGTTDVFLLGRKRCFIAYWDDRTRFSNTRMVSCGGGRVGCELVGVRAGGVDH